MAVGVWVVGGPGDREDLRYSLRSVAANAPAITQAWIVGDPPAWFNGVTIPLEPKPEKYANQRASLTAVVHHPGAPETFWLFNDDMYVIEPTTDLPIIRNKASASQWNTDHPVGSHGPSCWTCAVKHTAAWAMDRAGRDVWLYENHTPLHFDTSRLRDQVNAYPDQPLTVGELYPLAGAAGEGGVVGNAKVKAVDSLAAKLALPMPYLSGNPDSWAGPLGEYVRGLFTQACRWER